MRTTILSLLALTIASAAININTAPVDSLDKALPGVGPVLAHKLDSARSVRPFASCAALDSIKGIGPAKLAKICPLVTF